MPRFKPVPSTCRIAAALSLCLLLSACTIVSRKPLREDTLPISGTLPVELHLGQQEILVETQNTGPVALGGGLLGSLAAVTIDFVASRRDERRAAAVRDALIDADFDTRILDLIQRNIDPSPIARELAFETYRDDPVARASAGTMENRDPVLSLSVSYSLTHDFGALRVRLVTTFGTRKIRKGRDRSKYAYAQTFDHITLLPGDRRNASQDKRAAMWAEIGQDRISEMVLEGVLETIEMMNWTYETASAPPKQGEAVRFEYTASVYGRGKVDRHTEDRRWVRTGRRILVSIPR